jgi:hypothetical protein
MEATPSQNHFVIVFADDEAAISALHKDIIDLYPETGSIERRTPHVNWWAFIIPMGLPPPPGAGMRHDVLLRYLRSAAAAYRFQWSEMNFDAKYPAEIMVNHS